MIPAYRASNHILGVLSKIPKIVDQVFVVDDACPDLTGKKVLEECSDPRVRVIFNSHNLGVGGAVIQGYKKALEGESDIIVKLDADGQMNPAEIQGLVSPIVSGHADYCKGNRFDSLDELEQMPRLRILGNAVLSIMSKFSSGYWNITDPTNGFTAVHADVLRRINLDKLRKSYFFESDLLFRLALVRAVVMDIPMTATYGEEVSSLKVRKVIPEFLGRHLVNFLKRIFYNYYLREWNIASFELPIGLVLLLFGSIFGVTSWTAASAAGVAATAGQVMISAIAIIIGTQLVLAFLSYDVNSVPRHSRRRN